MAKCEQCGKGLRSQEGLHPRDMLRGKQTGDLPGLKVEGTSTTAAPSGPMTASQLRGRGGDWGANISTPP